MEFVIPLVLALLLLLVPVAVLLVRGRGLSGPARSGPHPDDRHGVE